MRLGYPDGTSDSQCANHDRESVPILGAAGFAVAVPPVVKALASTSPIRRNQRIRNPLRRGCGLDAWSPMSCRCIFVSPSDWQGTCDRKRGAVQLTAPRLF